MRLAGLVVVMWALMGSGTALGAVRATLTWDVSADVDLHVWDADGNQAAFQAPDGIPRALLSSDVTTGLGPETFTDDDAPSTRAFTYGVCYFSGADPANVTLTLTDPDGSERTVTALLQPGEGRLLGSSPAGTGFVPPGVDCTGAPPGGVDPASADLDLAQSVTPIDPAVGDNVTYTYAVSNAGPADATGVALTSQLPDGLTFVSADPGCTNAAGTVTCDVGDVIAGDPPVTRSITARSTRAGTLAPTTATVAGAQTDPVPASNTRAQTLTVSPAATTTGVPAAVPPAQTTPPPPPPDAPGQPGPPPPSGQAGPPVPPPVAGQTVNAGVVSGTVLIKVNGKFVPLTAGQSIPFGSTVDARHGVVKITAAVDASGATQSANFGEGMFTLKAVRDPGLITELDLTGGSFADCRTGKRARARRSTARAAAATVKRKLWGDGHGSFRTRGKYGSATVRGTKWTTEDRCDGTKVSVQRGLVAVRDIPKRKTVLVPAGKSYVASAPKAKGARRKKG